MTMIATLNGKISQKLIESIVLDVNGVGYGLLIPQETHSKVNVDSELMLYVYEHIRENSYDLYGFAEIETKELFIKLINVNGVGPKVALNILGIGSVSRVREAIATGNIKLIQTAPGVGKRVAERVLIELKDKVGLLSSLDESTLLVGDDSALQDEAVQALVALGYSVVDAVNSLKPIDTELSTKERVTLALKTR
jgi:Holliday junction DNA helicase RuvA